MISFDGLSADEAAQDHVVGGGERVDEESHVNKPALCIRAPPQPDGAKQLGTEQGSSLFDDRPRSDSDVFGARHPLASPRFGERKHLKTANLPDGWQQDQHKVLSKTSSLFDDDSHLTDKAKSYNWKGSASDGKRSQTKRKSSAALIASLLSDPSSPRQDDSVDEPKVSHRNLKLFESFEEDETAGEYEELGGAHSSGGSEKSCEGESNVNNSMGKERSESLSSCNSEEEEIFDANQKYAEFLDLMREPEALSIVKKLKLFIVSCQLEHSERNADFRGEQDTPLLSESDYLKHVENRVISFFEEMELVISEHSMWKDSSERELGYAREGIEKYVCSKLYDILYAMDPDEVAHGKRLEARMDQLREIVTADHLDVPKSCRNEMVLDLVQEELRKMNQSFSPVEKVDCIVRACSLIFNTLSNSSRAAAVRYFSTKQGHDAGALGADDFVPSFFFAVLQARVPSLWSNIEFIRRYRNPNSLLSKSGYCFVNLRSAVEFFEMATHESFVNMNPEEWTLE
mmetsp:Transcript_6982/g.11072  ORF Transcript_6982/g.11072 Transcript_6982/m.11072 type:complete len:515 (+) Transcript_6982:159-1703(+)